MRLCFVTLVILCISAGAVLAQAVNPTPNYGLSRPPDNHVNWGGLINGNFLTIDTQLFNLSSGKLDKTGGTLQAPATLSGATISATTLQQGNPAVPISTLFVSKTSPDTKTGNLTLAGNLLASGSQNIGDSGTGKFANGYFTNLYATTLYEGGQTLGNTYLTLTAADTTYLSKATAQTTYLKISDAATAYLKLNGTTTMTGDFSMSKADPRMFIARSDSSAHARIEFRDSATTRSGVGYDFANNLVGFYNSTGALKAYYDLGSSNRWVANGNLYVNDPTQPTLFLGGDTSIFRNAADSIRTNDAFSAQSIQATAAVSGASVSATGNISTTAGTVSGATVNATSSLQWNGESTDTRYVNASGGDSLSGGSYSISYNNVGTTLNVTNTNAGVDAKAIRGYIGMHTSGNAIEGSIAGSSTSGNAVKGTITGNNITGNAILGENNGINTTGTTGSGVKGIMTGSGNAGKGVWANNTSTNGYALYADGTKSYILQLGIGTTAPGTNTLSVSGTTNLNGATTITGNTTHAGNILADNANREIGTSSTPFLNGYFTNLFEGSTNISTKYLRKDTADTKTGNLTLAGNLLPSGTSNIGSSGMGLQFATGHFTSVYGGTLYESGAALSSKYLNKTTADTKTGNLTLAGDLLASSTARSIGSSTVPFLYVYGQVLSAVNNQQHQIVAGYNDTLFTTLQTTSAPAGEFIIYPRGSTPVTRLFSSLAVSGDITPSSAYPNTYDIGLSAVKFRNGYFSDTVFTSKLSSSGALLISPLTNTALRLASPGTGWIQIEGPMWPDTTGTRDIGSPSKKFKDLYITGTIEATAIKVTNIERTNYENDPATGWYESSGGTIKYRKVNGIVYITGNAVPNGGTHTLPSGFWPPHDIHGGGDPGNSYGWNGGFFITTAGVVSVYTISNTEVSFTTAYPVIP